MVPAAGFGPARLAYYRVRAGLCPSQGTGGDFNLPVERARRRMLRNPRDGGHGARRVPRTCAFAAPARRAPPRSPSPSLVRASAAVRSHHGQSMSRNPVAYPGPQACGRLFALFPFPQGSTGGPNRRMSAVCITQAKAFFTCQFFTAPSTVRMVEDGGPPGKEYRPAGRQSRKDPGGPLNCEQVVNILEGPQNATFATGLRWVSYRAEGHFGNLGNFV